MRPNHALVTRLRTGTLSTQDYYRQLLRLVYGCSFSSLLKTATCCSDLMLIHRHASAMSASTRYRVCASWRKSVLHPACRPVSRPASSWQNSAAMPDAQLGLPALGSFYFHARLFLTWKPATLPTRICSTPCVRWRSSTTDMDVAW